MTLTATLPVALGDFSSVSALNDQDELVGTSTASLPVAWQNGLYIWPGLYASDSTGSAFGINQQGQIVGVSNTSSANHPVLWQDGNVQEIANAGGSARLLGINDNGSMVGSSRDSQGYDNAYVVRNGVAIDLGALPGGDSTISSAVNSRAQAINDAEQIVGYSMTSFGVDHATLWQNGSITDLGGIANSEASEALAINKSGLIVGYAVDANGIDQAVTWLNGAMTVLPDLQSTGHSVAFAVNDAGLIVGSSDVDTRSGWQQHAVVWQNGALIDLNSLLPANSGWVLNSATAINNNGEVAGMATFSGFATFGYTLSIGDASGPAVSASAALQAFAAAPHSAAWNVSDSAATILANLDALENMAAVAKLLQITFTDATTPVLTLSDTQWTSDSYAVGVMAGGFSVHITGVSAADAQTRFDAPHVTAVGIADTSADIENDFATLEGWASSGKLLSITLTDASPTFNVTASDLSSALIALSLVESPYRLDVVGVTASQAMQLASNPHLSAIAIDDTAAHIVGSSQSLGKLTASMDYVVADTAANISANLDALEALNDAGSSVVLGVAGTNVTLSLTPVQLTKDFHILHNATGSFVVSVDASQSNLDIYGLGGHATTVLFSGKESEYTVSNPNGQLMVSGGAIVGDGATTSDGITVSGGTRASDVLQLQFSDNTITVAANKSFGEYMALLYQGALGRTPDAAGLEGWSAIANALPASEQATGVYALSNYSGNFNGTLSIAAGFTNSAEFEAKYGSLTNAQFVTQLYSNILDRAPDSGGYSSWMTALTPVSQGGLGESREYVLVGFAESAEAISNATHGFTGQSGSHAAWLFLT